MTPESVRWLISRGRYEEAENILQKIAKFNKVKAPSSFGLNQREEQLPMVDENQMQLDKPQKDQCVVVTTQPARRSLIDVFKTPILLRIMLIMMFCW